jgi:hypothetical protein
MPLDNIPAAPRYADEIGLLDRTRHDIRDPKFWCKGALKKQRWFGFARHSHCLMGALLIADGREIGEQCRYEGSLSDAFINVAQRLDGLVPTRSVQDYNNHPGVCHVDILALIDKTRAEFVRAEFVRAGQIEAIMDYGAVAELVEGI